MFAPILAILFLVVLFELILIKIHVQSFVNRQYLLVNEVEVCFSLFLSFEERQISC